MWVGAEVWAGTVAGTEAGGRRKARAGKETDTGARQSGMNRGKHRAGMRRPPAAASYPACISSSLPLLCIAIEHLNLSSQA